MKRRWLRVFGWGLVAALIGTAFAAGVWAGRGLLQLDRRVTARFEGRMFRLPSRVYAAPVILYPGLDVERADLAGILEHLGYRREPRLPIRAPGGYHRGRGLWRIYARAFEHPRRAEPARRVVIRLAGAEIGSVRDVATGRELAALVLEPQLLGSYYGGLRRELRDLVRLEELPPYLIDAVLVVEDRRFERHHGVDLRRIVGAALTNLRAGSIREGGSTVTQQLAKNFFLTPERTFRRKAHEAALAVLIEARYSKEEILEAYLNEIYLGQRGAAQIHGVGEASRTFFGKSAVDLELHEAALLAAAIQRPNGVSPHRDPRYAKQRRDFVLGLMHREGYIDGEQLVRARARELVVAADLGAQREPRYFLDALRRQLVGHYDGEVLANEGLHIYSTLDPRLQRRATEALREGLRALEARHPELAPGNGRGGLEGCLVALRPQTGEVLALVGGRDYGRSQFDRCSQARRPVGSVFKPIVYLAALEAGSTAAPDSAPLITLGSFLEDVPFSISTGAGQWSPKNYDRRFRGRVGVRYALEHSLNVATARLALDIGIDRVVALARRLGIESPLPALPSLALGAVDLSPLEVARAYATLANGGLRPELRFFEDVAEASGEVLDRGQVAFQRAVDPGAAYLAISLLEGVMARGTARAVSQTLTGPLAGKTGTSDDNRDAWFAGFTPELTVVVWVGFDEPRSLGLPSSRVALPIWRSFLRAAVGARARGSFVPPPTVETVEIDPETGALALASCPRRREEYFLRGTAPERTCPVGGERRPEEEEEGFRNWLRRLLGDWF